MGYRPSGTICGKHDDAYLFADKARDLLGDLMSAIEKAKEDGIAMERGLDTKRDRIKELEEEVTELKETILDLQKTIDDLNDQLSEAEA